MKTIKSEIVIMTIASPLMCNGNIFYSEMVTSTITPQVEWR